MHINSHWNKSGKNYSFAETNIKLSSRHLWDTC